MAEAEAAAGPAPKSGKPKLFIIIGAVVLLLGVGGGAYVLGALGGSDAADAGRQVQSDGKGGHGKAERPEYAEGAEVPIESFVVNLADDEAQRYLKVTMKVAFFDAEVPPRFNAREAQIRDLVLTLLSSKNVGDVRTVEGKAQLRDEIIARINRVLDDDAVKAIYFSEFIVQ